jgi:hypothetical protein
MYIQASTEGYKPPNGAEKRLNSADQKADPGGAFTEVENSLAICTTGQLSFARRQLSSTHARKDTVEAEDRLEEVGPYEGLGEEAAPVALDAVVKVALGGICHDYVQAALLCAHKRMRVRTGSCLLEPEACVLTDHRCVFACEKLLRSGRYEVKMPL